MSTAAPSLPIAVLDLGTARTRLVQAQITGGQLRYLGHETAASQGVRKGAVVGLAEAAETIRRMAAGLEQRTGVPIERVFLSCSGAHVRGVASQAGVALTSRSREITREDTRRVLDLARNIALPEDRQILHVVPQEFVLDRQAGIHEPVGMLASRLEARIYAITVAAGVKDNLVLAANHAGLEVEEIIFAPLACAEACLLAEDRFAGVALVDMGAGSTGVLVYNAGSLVHAAVIPIGGDHFTGDISIVLRTPLAEGERLKQGIGTVAEEAAAASSLIEVPGGADQEPRQVPLRLLNECLQSRARELVERIRAELAKGGVLGAGVLLSGGGVHLAGLSEMIASATGSGVRTATPTLLEGMPGELAEPEYCFVVGACYYAHRLLAREMRPPSLWEKVKAKWIELAD